MSGTLSAYRFKVGAPQLETSFNWGTGKDIQCLGGQQLMVFGHTVYPPVTLPAGCASPLTLIAPATNFDIASLSPGQEVIVALVDARDLPAGNYSVSFRWFRDADQKLLYEYADSYSFGYIHDISYISWIGFVADELFANGPYHVDITFTGYVVSFSESVMFEISGVSPTTIALRAIGLPANAEMWLAYYRSFLGGDWITDNIWWDVAKQIGFSGIFEYGRFMCYVWDGNNVLGAYMTGDFSLLDNGLYDYDILGSRIIHVGSIVPPVIPPEPNFRNLVSSYSRRV